MKKKIKPMLNKKEYELYFIIKDFIEINHYSPTYRELLDKSEYKSVSSIMTTIFKLAELGFIEIATNEEGNIIQRSIRIIYTKENIERLEEIKRKIEERENE